MRYQEEVEEQVMVTAFVTDNKRNMKWHNRDTDEGIEALAQDVVTRLENNFGKEATTVLNEIYDEKRELTTLEYIIDYASGAPFSEIEKLEIMGTKLFRAEIR